MNRRLLVITAAALLVACLSACQVSSENQKNTEASTDQTAQATSQSTAAGNSHIQGIDVSHYSGDVDWTAVANTYTFAISKATEGDDFVDPKYAENWAAMKEAGLIRGAYHFYDVSLDPTVQAENFIKTVTLEDGDLPPILDIETLDGNTVEDLPGDLTTFLEKVEAHFGLRPMINTDHSFWNEHVNTSFTTYPLWVSNTEVEQPNLPNVWQDWVMWQYMQNQQVDGVANTADVSYFQGTESQMKAFIASSRLEKSTQ